MSAKGIAKALRSIGLSARSRGGRITITSPAAASWPSSPAPGHRTCYRDPLLLHHTDYAHCDCLRTELPSWAQASGSGRLATDHEGMARAGRVTRAREAMGPQFCDSWDRLYPAKNGPRAKDDALVGVASDRAIRERVSAARAERKLGRRS